MAQLPYRANLSSAVFPLTIAKSGRTIINPRNIDQNFDRRVDPEGEQKNAGIPQAMYMENVFPTNDGYQSIGFVDAGTITVPATEEVTGIISVRLPVVTSTEFGIDFLDEGDDLTEWEKTADASGGGLYTQVLQSASIGNPVDSYEFRGDETNDPGEQPAMWKEFDVAGSTNVRMTVQAAIGPQAQNQRFGIIATASPAGAGVGILYDGGSGFMLLAAFGGFMTYGVSGISGGTVAAPGMVPGDWYQFVIDITVNVDNTKTLTATMYDTDLTTVLATVTADYAYLGGNFFGMTYGETSYDTPDPYYSMNWDNIRIQADGIGFESELDSATLAFFSNDTARWSHSLVDFENLVPTLPVDFVAPVSQNEISVAFVRGIAYLCIRTISTLTTKIYTLSIAADTGILTVTDVTVDINDTLPSPFTIDDVNCIVGSFNYLILLTKATAFWSSTTTPTDFLPSLVSGAGYEFVGNLKDNITFAKDHATGFAIYTSKNVIFASYTGNARYPWKFREVQGSGGYSFQTQVSGDTNTPTQIGVTNTGQMQAITPDAATNISPEVSDFFERSATYDRWNPLLNTFSLVQGQMRGPMDQFQIALYLDRYVVASYGTITGTNLNAFEYALIFDLQLRRLGKIKTSHNFTYCDERYIYFVEKNSGDIERISMDIYEIDEGDELVHNGMILFGKFQHRRNKFIQMELVDVESTTDTSIIPIADRALSAVLVPTFDGKNFTSALTLSPNITRSIGALMSHNCHTTAQNFCLAIQGAFDLASLELVFNEHGEF